MRLRSMVSRIAVRFGFALALTACVASCARQSSGPSGPFDHLMVPVDGRFIQVSSYDTAGGNVDRLEIAQGDSAVLLDRTGPGVIRRIWITVFSRDPHYLRRIALEMYWDGEEESSVRAPLGDFFGNGFEKRHYASLPMGVSSGGFYVYLPMPFRRRARIVVRNGTGQPIDAFYFNVDVLETDLPEELPTFHASWRRDRRTTHRRPHLVVDAHGRGQLVGISLNAESHAGRLWFLEGDEIFHIDGERRGQGTGTEDYFNAGWYFESGEFAAPYHGLILKDDSAARIAAYRWHIPDPIPFRDSIRVELEHGHANESVADYATMAYWYQVEPHRPLPPLPAADERRVMGAKLPPGVVPAESLLVERRPDVFAFIASIPRPDRYEVLVLPHSRPGPAVRYRVADGSWRTLLLEDDEEAGLVMQPVVIDTISAHESVTVERDLADPARLTDCERCPCGDLCPAAIWPRPIRRWATSWNIVGPFPNPPRLGGELSPALDSVYPPERDPALSRQYIAPGGRSVRWREARAGEDGRVRLNVLFEPNDRVAAYAQSFLYAPAPREAVLLLGADDAHVLWVNGERVSQRQGRHISIADDLAIPVRLEEGWNRVLLKVADLDGGWAFMLRAADPTGELRWARRPGG